MLKPIRPMLAENYVEEKVVFPIGMQPKIDGVRGLKLTSLATGRSMMPHANRYTTNLFSHGQYDGLDGEMAVGEETSTDLCRLTSSALSTQEGEPAVVWHLFDYVVPETRHLPYQDRYARLTEYAQSLPPQYVKVVPMVIVHNVEELRAQDAAWLLAGYEGSCLRRLDGLYKEGRSTVKEGGLLRIKHFTEEEAIVTGIIEGNINDNEKTVNLLGLSERSSHKANKRPNGLVGTLECVDVKTQKRILVGAGKLTHKQRKYFFENPHEIIGKMIKYQTFPKGVKDKPRFPTFNSFRIESDV